MKKNIVIIILSILVLGLGGYLVYDKVLSSYNKEDVVEKQNNKEMNYDIISAQFIMDSFLNNKMINVLDRISQTKLDEETKLAMAIANTNPSFNSYTCADFFDMNTNYSEYKPESVEQWACMQNDMPTSYSYENVNNQYKKFFGGSKEAPKQGVLYGEELYDYSNKKDYYVELSPLYGPIRSGLYYYEIESAKIKGNQLKIKISYLRYVSHRPEEMFDVAKNLDSFVYSVRDTQKELDNIKKVYNDDKNTLPTLTFVFEKENDNYVLKSVE